VSITSNGLDQVLHLYAIQLKLHISQKPMRCYLFLGCGLIRKSKWPFHVLEKLFSSNAITFRADADACKARAPNMYFFRFFFHSSLPLNPSPICIHFPNIFTANKHNIGTSIHSISFYRKIKAFIAINSASLSFPSIKCCPCCVIFLASWYPLLFGVIGMRISPSTDLMASTDIGQNSYWQALYLDQTTRQWLLYLILDILPQMGITMSSWLSRT